MCFEEKFKLKIICCIYMTTVDDITFLFFLFQIVQCNKQPLNNSAYLNMAILMAKLVNSFIVYERKQLKFITMQIVFL